MKKLLFTVICSSQLLAIEPDPIPQWLPTEKEKALFQDLLKTESQSYTYASLGTTGKFFGHYRDGILGVEPFVGRRDFLSNHLAVDFGGGVLVGKVALPYAQCSILYYPISFQGPYLGIGGTVGAFIGFNRFGVMPWLNAPLTLGYQFRTKNGHAPFVQVQITPLTFSPDVGTATVSFGWDVHWTKRNQK